MRPAGARRLREDEHTARRAEPRLRLVDPAEAPPFEPPQAERRTVTITGQTVRAPRRRSPTGQQIASRPDRVALWAFLLGLFLLLVAAATASAAV